MEIHERNSSPHHLSKPQHLTFRVSVARLPWGQGGRGRGHRWPGNLEVYASQSLHTLSLGPGSAFHVALPHQGPSSIA